MARDVHRIIDEQIARWRTERQRQDKVSATDPDRPRPRVVTIANPLGANGSPIGARRRELLGIPAYESGDRAAHRRPRPRERVGGRDPRRACPWPLEEYMTALLTQHTFNAGDHLRALTRTVVALWSMARACSRPRVCAHPAARSRLDGEDHGSRGSAHRARGREQRSLRVGCPPHGPRQRRGARGVSPPLLRVAADDLQLYDLVVSSGLLDDQGCAEIIAAAYRARFAPPR